MKERIKLVRKHSKLTQTAFGERIGVKGNTVTGWETGIRSPSEAVINSICREFNINEKWLRTGEGNMLHHISRDDEIAAFIGEVMRSEDEDFRRRLIAVLSRLDVDEWKLLEKMALKLAAENKNED